MRKILMCCAAACLASAAGCVLAQDKYVALESQYRQLEAKTAVAAKPSAPGGRAPVAGAPADKPAAAEVSLTEGRKIVYTADLVLIVPDVDYGMQAALKMAKEMGGYLQNQSGSRMVIRVPAGRFEQALDRLGGLGTVAQKNISAADVTEKYFDLETRLTNAKALAGRLRALLANANVKEAIAIEHELARVQTDIDQLEGQFRLLASRIAHATITIDFRGAVRTLPPTLKVKLPFAWLHSVGLDRLLHFRSGDVY